MPRLLFELPGLYSIPSSNGLSLLWPAGICPGFSVFRCQGIFHSGAMEKPGYKHGKFDDSVRAAVIAESLKFLAF